MLKKAKEKIEGMKIGMIPSLEGNDRQYVGDYNSIIDDILAVVSEVEMKDKNKKQLEWVLGWIAFFASWIATFVVLILLIRASLGHDLYANLLFYFSFTSLWILLFLYSYNARREAREKERGIWMKNKHGKHK